MYRDSPHLVFLMKCSGKENLPSSGCVQISDVGRFKDIEWDSNIYHMEIISDALQDLVHTLILYKYFLGCF